MKKIIMKNEKNEIFITSGRNDFKRLFPPDGIIVREGEGTSILIEGEAGLGKTTLALQLATQAVNEYAHKNVKCLYYTFDQRESEIIDMIKSFNFIDKNEITNFAWESPSKIVNQVPPNLFNIIKVDKFDQKFTDIIERVIEHLELLNKEEEDNNPTIVVLDSIGAISDLKEINRQDISKMMDKMKNNNVMFILVRERSVDQIEKHTEYLTNVVIDLTIQSTGGAYLIPRTLIEIKKSRNQPSFRGPHEFHIVPKDNENKFGGFMFYPSLQVTGNISSLLKKSTESVITTDDDDAKEEAAKFNLPILDKIFSDYSDSDFEGVPFGQSILLNGEPGNHKTELGLHFLNQKDGNEKVLFVSFKIEKAALVGIKLIDKTFIQKDMEFIDGRIPFQTPIMIMAKIMEKIEMAKEDKRPIRRAVLFGIGMLETLPMFQGNPLPFLQVLINYFRNQEIANILIDWPQPGDKERLTAIVHDLVSAEINVKKPEDKANEKKDKKQNKKTMLSIKRINYHYIYETDTFELKLTNDKTVITVDKWKADTNKKKDKSDNTIKKD